MDDIKLLNEAIDIISTGVLTPIIYMINIEENICFVCFCDNSTPCESIAATEKKLSELLKIDAVIMDIREFSEIERMEIVQKAEMIYCADKNMQKLFELNLVHDFQKNYEAVTGLVDRVNNCDTIYLS